MDFSETLGIQDVLCPADLIELALGSGWLGILHTLLHPGNEFVFGGLGFGWCGRKKCGGEENCGRSSRKAHKFTSG